MTAPTNLNGMKTSELVAVYNGVSGKPAIAKWKRKVSDLVAAILKLKPDLYSYEPAAPSDRMDGFEAPADELAAQKGRAVDHAEPPAKAPKVKKAAAAKKAKVKADGAVRGAIRQLCEKLLLEVKGSDPETKRPLGLPYATILERVQSKFPEAETSLNCLRWYATKLNKQTGKDRVQMPVRPKQKAA
jgi:hypothetical protein